MKRNLRMLALGLAVVSPLAWFAMGANRGWTRTSVPVKTLDAVTGIEGIEYRKQFVPGLELLGGGLVFAAGVAATSLFFRNQQTKQTK